MTSLKKSTLTVMLDARKRSGQIARVPSGEDRRRIHIRLTARNREPQDACARVSERMASIGYAGFSDTGIDMFEDMPGRVLANLKSAKEAMVTGSVPSAGGRP